MADRKVIPSKLRWKLYKEADFKCVCCGADDLNKLEIDHIVPLCKGGDDSEYNYQVLCSKCNSRKGGYYGGEVFHHMRDEKPKTLYALIAPMVLFGMENNFKMKEITMSKTGSNHDAVRIGIKKALEV